MRVHLALVGAELADVVIVAAGVIAVALEDLPKKQRREVFDALLNTIKRRAKI